MNKKVLCLAAMGIIKYRVKCSWLHRISPSVAFDYNIQKKELIKCTTDLCGSANQTAVFQIATFSPKIDFICDKKSKYLSEIAFFVRNRNFWAKKLNICQKSQNLSKTIFSECFSSIFW